MLLLKSKQFVTQQRAVAYFCVVLSDPRQLLQDDS